MLLNGAVGDALPRFDALPNRGRTVGLREPVATAGRRRLDADDGGGRATRAGQRTVEARAAEGEEAAVAAGEPVAVAARRRGDADDRLGRCDAGTESEP